MISHIDHTNLMHAWHRFDEAVLFYGSVLALQSHSTVEVAGPVGLVRSQVMRTRDAEVRLVLNVAPLMEADDRGRRQAQHVAFACSDAFAVARAARGRGLDFLPVPDNYYADLQARFGLDDDRLSELSELDLLYDRDGAGEFVHFYTGDVRQRLLRGRRTTPCVRRLRRPQRPGPSGLPALEPEDDHEMNTLMNDDEAFSEHELPIGSDSAQRSQREMNAEMAAVSERYESGRAEHGEETQPRLNYPPYRSSVLRHPTKEPYHADPETIELYAPVFGHRDVDPVEADLTIQGTGEPIGERIVVTGRIVDGEGRPVRHQLVEIWQANAAGRYLHKRDQHPAPLDPNFTGVGRCLTDSDGHYRFTTIKPAPYPWKNHRNAWRPAHIHFSLFGTDFPARMITQMYFPGDPLFALDPIYQAITDQRARDRLVASYDHDVAQHEWNTGYRWDIVLTGSQRTWTEPEGEEH